MKCTACKNWVLKNCSGVRDVLIRMKDYECGLCKGFHDDENEVNYAKLGNDMMKVVQEFCYLCDIVGNSGSVQSSVTLKWCWLAKIFELSQVLRMWENSVIETERSLT